MQHSTTVVPAQPGFFTVEVVLDEHDNVVGSTQTPIIAWVVYIETDDGDPMGYPIPMTAHETDSRNPIVYPDGRVCDGDRTWSSVQDWTMQVKRAGA